MDGVEQEAPAVSRGPTTAWAGVQRRARGVVPRPIRRADLATFRALARREIPVVGPLLPRLSRAADHSRLWVVISAAVAVLGGRFGRRAAARGLLAIGATSALTNLPAKLLTGRTRPDLAVVPEIRRLARVPSSTSFPSGHSASAFAFATGASLEEPRLRLPLYALAGAVATSRVYTGVHYPGDALVGAAIGVAVARASTRTWPLTDRRPTAATATTGACQALGPDGDGLVIVRNTEAGGAHTTAAVDELTERLPRARVIDADPAEGLLASLRRAASEARVLGVAGGDGSVNAAAAVASELEIPLAIAPSGTFNHLAKDLRIDTMDELVDAVRDGRCDRMDLGECGDRVFVNAASIGAYPHLVAARERIERRLGRWPAALWGMLGTLRTARPLAIEIDGRPRRVWLLFVGNCRYADEAVPATRRPRLDDGQLDVRVLGAELPRARSRIVLSLLLGRVARSAAYQRWSATEVHVRSRQGPLQVATDGETWTGPEQLVIGKRPGALIVLRPSE